MADKTTVIKTLSMVAEFADGDDRTITVDNPDNSNAASLTAAVDSLGAYCQTNQIFLGDKTGANFTKFRSAKVVTKTKTVLDLS